MALPGSWRCPWRWPSALPAALLVAITSLLQGSRLGAALGAAAAWCARRFRPPARRPLSRRSPPRLLSPRRSPPRLLSPRPSPPRQLLRYRPKPSPIARFPSPRDQAVGYLSRERASRASRAATVIGQGGSTPTSGNCLGRAPPQTVRHRDPLPQDRSPEAVFPPKRMCRRETLESGAGSYCEEPRWTGRERKRRRQESAPSTADKAVQTEEAVKRPEEKRRQSLSAAPSLGKGRPRKRTICLLVPGKTHPLVLFPELNPSYPIVEEILEREREAAWQRSRWLLGPEAAITQGCSGTRRTWAASTTTALFVFGQAASTSTGLTDTSQPRSGSAPVLPGTPAPFSGQRPSGLAADAASSGSSTSASSTRRRRKDRDCKRHKARIHHFCNK